MHIEQLLPADGVLAKLRARDKKQALKLLSQRAGALTGIPDKEILSVLLEREHIGCTGMGNGVCIPHGRFDGLKAPVALFASLEKTIEFGAADGRPVDLVFMLLTPAEANTDHLKALAVLSRLLRDRALCENLRDAASPEALHVLLVAGIEDI